jgi:hypothetical protein
MEALNAASAVRPRVIYKAEPGAAMCQTLAYVVEHAEPGTCQEDGCRLCAAYHQCEPILLPLLFGEPPKRNTAPARKVIEIDRDAFFKP